MSDLWRVHVEIVQDIADWCTDIGDRFRSNVSGFFADVTLKDWVEIFYLTVVFCGLYLLSAWIIPW